MARNVLKISSERTGQTPEVRVVRSALYCIAAALLFGALWVELIYPPPWLASGLLFLTSAMLALALTGAFDNSGLDACWRARLPFLLAALFPPACWLLRLLLALPGGALSAGQPGGALSAASLPLALGELALAGLGAFLGALSATAVLYGLWEDNSPPGEPLRQEVLERHRQATGAPPPVPPAKRLFDLLAAGLGLLVSAPVWLACIFAIWFEDPGPLLFVKNSVGRGGGNFRQFKLRSMVRGAEEHTGPVLAQRDDPRVLACGRFLRKTALDELPQLLNILRGEMSFVGPRPQRTVLVCDYLRVMPEYAERHRVLPGLAGLAQVAGDYYLTPRQKLRFDRLYIRYSGLGFDLKLLFLAFLLTFYYRWRSDWDGHLPRRLLKWRPLRRSAQR